jgi:hypothetical protein
MKRACKSWQDTIQPSDDDMARKAAREISSEMQPVIAAYVARLIATGRDRPSFEAVAKAIEQDKSLAVADVVAIALQYRGGGTRPASKKAALEVIAKRFLEIVRNHTQGVQAALARPW